MYKTSQTGYGIWRRRRALLITWPPALRLHQIEKDGALFSGAHAGYGLLVPNTG